MTKVTEKRERRDRSLLRHLRRRLSNIQPYLFPLAGWLMISWRWTLHRTVKTDRRGPFFEYIRDGKPFIFTFWHEDTFPTMFEVSRAFLEGTENLFMVSPGRTGALGSYLLNLFHVQTVAGSGSNRGRKAVQKLTSNFHKRPRPIYILADGSRGPSHELRWGAIYLARDTGMPIIAGRAWGNNLICLWWTWMKLVLPLPWGRNVFLSSEPLSIPPDATKEELQSYREELQRRLDDLSQSSCEWLKHPEIADRYGPSFGDFPDPPRTASDDSNGSKT